MASESIGSVYPTQIPGYDDAADIKAALRLYHYGSTTVPANEAAILPNSVSGHLKALDTRLDTVESAGIGSDYRPTEPTNVPDGFIWVDSNSSGEVFKNKEWVLHDSGNLSGTQLAITGLEGESHYIIIKDADSSEPTAIEIDVNGDPFAQATGTGQNATSLDSFLGDWQLNLANTESSLKPFYPYSSIRDSRPISSLTYKLKHFTEQSVNPPQFTAGTYEVWSYK